MDEGLGLRERKKLETRRAIHEAGMELFVERGFADVSVVEIAARAGVSKMTVFNYFPTKEDIVLGPTEEEFSYVPSIVRQRQPGEPFVATARRAFLERLALHSPETGLDDSPRFLRILNLFRQTASLSARILMLHVRVEAALTDALKRQEPGDPRAPFAAGQVYAMWRTLQTQNTTRIFMGQSADEAYPDAVASAELGFAVLRDGLGDYLAR